VNARKSTSAVVAERGRSYAKAITLKKILTAGFKKPNTNPPRLQIGGFLFDNKC
jgi:hypothetical protein